VLDPKTSELIYSNAGHPPALVATHEGKVESLLGGHGAVLGITGREGRANAVTSVADTAALLLYTDGLVERRGRSFDEGVDAAGALLAEHRTRPAHEIADVIMNGMAPDEGYSDDVALLVVRPVTTLHRTFPAAPEQVAAARGELRAWLAENEVPRRLAEDVLLAVGEACTNAVEHAYPADRPADARFGLHGRIVDSELTMTITDHGRWRPPDPASDPFRGRGLVLMRAVMKDVELTHEEHGTTVVLRVTLDYATGS